jgi:hypothetical protein
MNPRLRLLFFAMLFVALSCKGQDNSIISPDGGLRVDVNVVKGMASYRIYKSDTVVLEASRLGVMMEDEDFSNDLKLTGHASAEVKETFTMLQGKRKNCVYNANSKTFKFVNKKGNVMHAVFQVSNDGVAFRYLFPGKTKTAKTITRENTSFRMSERATGFLQPMSEAKTGWSKVNPCYEEFYMKEIPVGTPAPSKAGWVFPALFHSGNRWLLITEADVKRNYAASRLEADAPAGEYRIGFPGAQEVFPGGGFLPSSSGQWESPWRIIVIGSLKTVIESDLGVALAAPPAKNVDLSFVKPGHSSWSWALLKDDSTVFDVQKRFIDYASDMHWEYCLIDADWDQKIGYEKVKTLAAYAKKKNVGLILWYNSAGSWNDTPYTPKSKLLTHEARTKEFALLNQMGIKGVKIDFFGGDGQSMIDYYIDILEDAADHKLLVNFHGATLPRGWHRTYPHMMSAEAIKGFEYVTFDQGNAEEQPVHCTIIPFTRNAFDPMDFTPLSLDSVPRINRRTSSAYELALSVIFLSGIQHFVERPAGMKKANESIKQFLRDLPTSWDDTRYISGYPGKDVVVARKSGNKWWVAGINGEDKSKTFIIDTQFSKASKVKIINDAARIEQLDITKQATSGSINVNVERYGGFVLVLEE